MKGIAKKIGIIDDIAYQTNLLAPECRDRGGPRRRARQGIRGGGGRVRKLAGAQPGGRAGNRRARGQLRRRGEKAGKLLVEIVPAIGKTSELVQEIAAASQEQSSSVGQINTSMTQLNQITQQNASSSEELAATAEEMSSQAENLQQQMAFFKIEGGLGMTQAARAAAAALQQASHSSATRPGARARLRLAPGPRHGEGSGAKRVRQVLMEATMGGQQYLTFSVSGETFGIAISAIKEIIEYRAPTDVPMMPAFIRGVINLRGPRGPGGRPVGALRALAHGSRAPHLHRHPRDPGTA
jgi:hypothetical protein